MKIGAKLQIGFAVGTVLICIIAVMGLNTASNLNNSVNDLALDKFKKVMWANNIYNQINSDARSIRNAIITEHPELINQELAKLPAGVKNVADNLDSLTRTVVSEEGKKNLEDLKLKRSKFLELRDHTVNLIKQNGVNGVNTEDEVEKILFTTLRDAQEEYFSAAKLFIVHQSDYFNKTAAQTDIDYNTAFTLILTLAIIAVLLSISIAFFTT
ncbi:MAG TPA: MCP four helix bundle domain-containing protein, partial [Candidatus Kapabacteria bacterium]|nr:MCP four helix bundle domain-containing protein [Candidatus Kapabacteria bacterium]